MTLDRPPPADVASVLRAAAVLDISEYDLFRLAWARWYGAEAARETLEPYFVAYMFHRTVPHWVRHFSRLVEARWRSGTLDRAALGVPRLARSRSMARRGARYAVTVALVVAVVVVLAEFAARVVHLGERCFFPPCY